MTTFSSSFFNLDTLRYLPFSLTHESIANIQADLTQLSTLYDEIVLGGEGDDSLKGGDDNDLIIAVNGNDSIDGGDGNDVIGAGFGDDLINGKAGDDYINPDTGNDTVNGGGGNDIIGGQSFNFIFLNPDPDDDLFNGEAGDDTIKGETGNDTLIGEAGDDRLHGNIGNDSLIGGDGNDILDGMGIPISSPKNGYDRDSLMGGNGDDSLIGTPGDDFLEGGEGADRFVFSFKNIDSMNLNSFYFFPPIETKPESGIDTIEDFNAEEGDKIVIQAATTISTDQFHYNSNTGALFFEDRQFAQLKPGLDFVPDRDVEFGVNMDVEIYFF